jgi:sirohydrochlorin cobaltochelatase
MRNASERGLIAATADRFGFGQVLICKTPNGFILSHREDEGQSDLELFQDPEDAALIARYDDSGKYRPLKTAPNLRHGWRLQITSPDELHRALELFYPGRLAVFAAWNEGWLGLTPLRETLNRQSGMYRVAATISDEQLNDVVADFCRSDGGCLRTIFWKRDTNGTTPSTKLPPGKFDPEHDQACSLRSEELSVVPLLCQEACNLLVNECRKAVKAGNRAT